MDLEPSFPLWLQMAHLSPDSGEQAGPALLTPLVVAAKQDSGETGPWAAPLQLLLCNYAEVTYLHSLVAQALVLNS